jgi:hypothetical protein
MEKFEVQLHTGDNILHPIDTVLLGRKKPNGGFWTSTFKPEGKYASDWVRYWSAPPAVLSSPEDFAKAMLLHVSPQAKVRHIDGTKDFEDLICDFPLKLEIAAAFSRELNDLIKEKVISLDTPVSQLPIRATAGDVVNWVEVAEIYDGIHLTDRGVTETQWEDRFAGWSCESTCWFRPAFEKVIPYFEPVVRSHSEPVKAPQPVGLGALL